MSTYHVEYCVVCDRRIEKTRLAEFHYTKYADGPYCDQCWFFVEHIEALRDRVTALEELARLDQQRR